MEEPAKLDDTLDAKPYEPPNPGRSLTVFYVVVGIVVALGLFGVWFWRAHTVWWFDADEAKRRQVEAAAKLGVPVEKSVDLGDGVTLDLVLIPAGRFKMGSPVAEQGRAGDEVQHWAAIARPFYMGKAEITQEQWEKVMGKNPGRFKGPRNPVETVSWDDCQEFLKKLNGLAKGEGEFRLPTEAQWEWACRAGTKTRFSSGDASGGLGVVAWHRGNAGDKTHPVGQKPANAWGLHDMHGNVWEWCGDWKGDDYYAQSPRYDPAGPAAGAGRVVRGGSWFSSEASCRSASRDEYALGSPSFSFFPKFRQGYVGLRVVLIPAAH